MGSGVYSIDWLPEIRRTMPPGQLACSRTFFFVLMSTASERVARAGASSEGGRCCSRALPASLLHRPKHCRGNSHPYPILSHDDFKDIRLVFVDLIGLQISSACVRISGCCHVDASKLQPVALEMICVR
jgi:hypothetical protein